MAKLNSRGMQMSNSQKSLEESNPRLQCLQLQVTLIYMILGAKSNNLVALIRALKVHHVFRPRLRIGGVLWDPQGMK